MSKSSTYENILDTYLKRIELGDDDDVKTIYRATVGPEGKRLSNEIIIYLNGNVENKINDEMKSGETKELSVKLDPKETQSLFRRIGVSLRNLSHFSQPPFLPDSLVGSITIQVGDERFTSYFLLNEKDRLLQSKPIPSELAQVIQDIQNVSSRI